MPEVKIQLLLVEDQVDLAATIVEYLELNHILVDHASSATLAYKLIANQNYHLVLLDINLPDGSGFELCHEMRNQLGISTPVLMLTARDSLDDKLAGFDAGADDYLVKPFDLAELLMRIKALYNRSYGQVGRSVLQVADLQLNINSTHVERQGKAINLSPIAFNILALLMRETPRVISRAEIEMHIWGEELPDSDSLRSHLYMLRKAVDKPFDQPLIKTVKGMGIQLSAEH